MQHLKAQVRCSSRPAHATAHSPIHALLQLIAEFGDNAYRANEQLVIKLLAQAIQSWSSTKRLEPDSVAFAFFSCVDIQRCLDWATRLHGLRHPPKLL